MSLKTSTGLRNALLDSGSLFTIFTAGFLKIYSGAVPTSADAAATGTLLCTISLASSGTGIDFNGAASGGVLSKSSGQSWTGVNVASGTASYFRHVAVGDTAGASGTEPRMQGEIATAGAELNFSSTTLTSGATQTIDYYSAALPTL